MVVQELAETEGGAGDNRHREVGVADAEPARTAGRDDVAARARGRAPVRGRNLEAVTQQHLAQVGLPAM